MSPFRTRPEDHVAPVAASEAVHEAVGQMVRQFADPMAFYRELVQNSIDAGATGIDVRVDWEPAARDGDEGTLHVSVGDDGAGMDQDVVERSLLVLFRSTKDKDPTKIGKFGVGFFSVFALNPEVVLVDTGTRDDREGLRLHLRPDFSYELETSAPRKGTTVTLRIPMKRGLAGGFVERSAEALARWCPHVEVPLHLEAPGVPGHESRRRIDAPFSVEGDATIAQRAGGAAFAMAVAAEGSVAYYNRGILLHASKEPLVQGARVKVNAPDLHHTLSRDNVRADEALARVTRQAHQIAAGALRDELLAALRRLAAECAVARHHDLVHPKAAAWLSLVEVSQRPPFALPSEALSWPLVAPVTVEQSARATATFERGGWLRTPPRVHVAEERDAFAKAVAALGVPVVDLGVAGVEHAARARMAVAAAFGERVVDAEARYCMPGVLHAAGLDEREVRLVERVGELMAAAGHGPVVLGDVAGAGAALAWVALEPRARAQLHAPDLVVDVDEGPFTLAPAKVLVLNRHHPRVWAALEASARDPAVAALALARMVLLSARRLDEERDAALFTRALLGG